MCHMPQSQYFWLSAETWYLLIWIDEPAILIFFIVPLLVDQFHVFTNKLNNLFQTDDIIWWVRLRKQAVIATVQVAVSNIFQNTAFEWPKSSCPLVQGKSGMNIDYLGLALIFGQITFSLAAHAHQIQALNHVEDLDRHFSLRVLPWRSMSSSWVNLLHFSIVFSLLWFPFFFAFVFMRPFRRKALLD